MEPLEPASEAGKTAQPDADAGAEPDAAPAPRLDPLPLETPAPEEEPADPCPRCGGIRFASGGPACVRCGFDPSVEVDETAADPSGASRDDDRETLEPALPRALRFERVWTIAALLAAFGALAYGYLSVAAGLYPSDDAEVAWPGRLENLLRLPLLVGVWSLCGLAALATTAWLQDRRFGDLGVVARRLFVIMAVSRVAALIAAPWPLVEFSAEAAAQAGLLLLGLVALFRVSIREALLTLVFTISAFVVLLVLAQLLTWIIA